MRVQTPQRAAPDRHRARPRRVSPRRAALHEARRPADVHPQRHQREGAGGGGVWGVWGVWGMWGVWG